MATANIKITALSDITSANMTYNDLVAVVDMNGTPETKKANIQLVGNLILNEAGGSYFPAAAQAVLAQSVTNAAQPNITSVGTLSSLTVTANVSAGNLSASGTINGVLVGEGGNISNVQVGNVAGLGNIATINLDGNVSNVFRGDGTFGPEGAGGNANYANFAGTAFAVAGANVSGEVGFAAVANSVALANVSGAGNIASINLDGNVSNVLRGDGTWDSDANSTYGDGNVVSLLAAFGSNTITTTGLVTADLGGGSNVIGANVTGEVSFAATANAVAYANVSGTPTLGNIASTNYDGNASNVLHGDGTWSADATDYSNANVVSLLAAFGSNTITTTGLVTADLGGGSNIIGANVTGEVSFAATANAVAYANVSGTPTLGNISTINLDGNASNVLRGDGTFGADANSSYGDSNVVTLLGSFGSNTVDTTGNISAGNLITGGEANVYSLFVDAGGANVNGNVKIGGDISNVEYIFANANISTNNNFIALGDVFAVNANVSGQFIGDGGGISNVAVANVTGLGNIATVDLDGNVSNVLRGDGTFGAAGIVNGALTSNLDVAGYDISNIGNIGSNLLPNANITYDLGSPTQRWNDIYLANSTIYLGDATISADNSSRTITFNAPVTVTGANNFISAGSFANLETTTMAGNNQGEYSANAIPLTSQVTSIIDGPNGGGVRLPADCPEGIIIIIINNITALHPEYTSSRRVWVMPPAGGKWGFNGNTNPNSVGYWSENLGGTSQYLSLGNGVYVGL